MIGWLLTTGKKGKKWRNKCISASGKVAKKAVKVRIVSRFLWSALQHQFLDQILGTQMLIWARAIQTTTTSTTVSTQNCRASAELISILILVFFSLFFPAFSFMSIKTVSSWFISSSSVANLSRHNISTAPISIAFELIIHFHSFKNQQLSYVCKSSFNYYFLSNL